MKKLFYLLGLATALGITASCDNEPKNPGDFSVKSELRIGNVASLTTGNAFTIDIVREIDTVYQHEYTRTDTVTGRTDTLYYPSKFTARYYEAAPIYLDSPADTFSLPIYTNARWDAEYAISLPTAAQWLYLESGTTGGGDSELIFRVARNRNKTPRATVSSITVLTKDSTVMYRIPFRQNGEN